MICIVEYPCTHTTPVDEWRGKSWEKFFHFFCFIQMEFLSARTLYSLYFVMHIRQIIAVDCVDVVAAAKLLLSSSKSCFKIRYRLSRARD